MTKEDAMFTWEALSGYHEDFQSDPGNHPLECDCSKLEKDLSGSYQEDASDHCTCNYYEAIEQFLMYIYSRRAGYKNNPRGCCCHNFIYDPNEKPHKCTKHNCTCPYRDRIVKALENIKE